MVQDLPEHPVGSQRGSWGTIILLSIILFIIFIFFLLFSYIIYLSSLCASGYKVSTIDNTTKLWSNIPQKCRAQGFRCRHLQLTISDDFGIVPVYPQVSSGDLIATAGYSKRMGQIMPDNQVKVRNNRLRAKAILQIVC
jgi:hypothetical protein